MNKYKTFEELKEELGDKFEDYMYEANIELLNKLNKIKKIINDYAVEDEDYSKIYNQEEQEIMKLLEEKDV